MEQARDLTQIFTGVLGMLLLCGEWTCGDKGETEKGSRNYPTTSWRGSRVLTLPLSLRTIIYSIYNPRESTYCVPGTMPGVGDAAMNLALRICAVMELPL